MANVDEPVEKFCTLESVDAYNKRRLAERAAAEDKAKRTGVACPRCGGELLWDQSLVVNMLGGRPQRSAKCDNCCVLVQLEG